MELETLEVLLEVNTSRIQKSIDKVMPNIEKMMSRIESITGQSIKKTEDNLSIDKGVTKFGKQLEKLEQVAEKVTNNLEGTTKKAAKVIEENLSSGVKEAVDDVSKNTERINNIVDKAMANLEASTRKSSVKVEENLSSGVKEARSKLLKEIDVMTKEMNAKISQMGRQDFLIGNIKHQKTTDQNFGGDGTQFDGKLATAEESLRNMQKESADYLRSIQNNLSNMTVKDPVSKEAVQKVRSLSDEMSKLANRNGGMQTAFQRTKERNDALKASLSATAAEMRKTSMATGSAASGALKVGASMSMSERVISRFGGVASRVSNVAAHGLSRLRTIASSLFGVFVRTTGGAIRGFMGLGSIIGKTGGVFASFVSRFTKGANKVNQGTRGMSMGNSAFLRSMRYLLPTLIVYTLIGGAIRKLSSGMFSALKTNSQFTSSLNQIKVNLLTAFYPIYTAILPAINALMSALATLTGQFAALIATIFGSTYQAAKQGASGLYDNVQALEDTGSAADKTKEKVKKLQRSLMGFDEINRIGLQEEEDDDTSLDSGASKAPGVDFGAATGDYQPPAWLKDMQNLLKDFFKPFQDAWNNVGKKVVDAWKYAIDEIIKLAAAIGKSFMEVWTNGTGQTFIENILTLLATVLNIIGDIAKAFREAWEEDGRGTALIQSYFDAFNKILEMLIAIGESFREAWNDGTGKSIMANILEIATNIYNTFGNLAESFTKAWNKNNVGKEILSDILGIFDDMLGHLNNITEATAKWAKKLDFEPLLKSIKKLLDNIRPLADNIGGGLEWFFENVLLPLADFVIQDALPTFLDMISGALKLVNGVIEVLKPLFLWFWDRFLKPIASWTGGVFIAAMKNIGNILGTIGDVLMNNKEFFQLAIQIGTDFIDGILDGMMNIISGIYGWLKENIFDPIVNGVKAMFGIHSPSTVFAELGGFLIKGLMNGISGLIKNVSDIFSNLWKSITGIFANVGKWFKEKFDGAVKLIKEVFSTIGKWFGDRWNDITKVFANVGKWFKDKFDEGIKNIKTAFNNIGSWFKDRYNDVTNVFNNIGTWFKDKFNTAWTNIKNVFNSVGTFFTGIWDKIKNIFTNIGKSVGDAISGGFKGVLNSAIYIVEDIINDAIHLINSALKFINKIPGVNLGTISYVNLPRFAQGGFTGDGPSLVNDGSGANWQEMYILPNGELGLFPDEKNLMVNLPKGTQILSGSKTAEVLNESNQRYGLTDGLGGNTMSGFGELQLPEMFNQKPIDYNNLSSVGSSEEVSNYGLANMDNSLTGAIMLLIQTLGAQASQAQNGDIIINVGGTELGRIAISEINKYQRQVGQTLIEI